MEPIFITYCNSEIDNTHKNTENLVRTLINNNWKYVLLGRGDKWENFVKTRMICYLNYIRQLNPQQIVIFGDARDVFCVKCPDKFIDDFKKYNKPIVVSMELFAEGKMEYDFNKTYCQVAWLNNYWQLYNINPDTILRKYVNNGLVAGYVKDLIACFEWIISKGFTDDQLGMGNYVNTFPELIYADIHAELLHTTSAFICGGLFNKKCQNDDSVTLSELTGHKSYFLHIPGLPKSKGQSFLYSEVNQILNRFNQQKMIECYPEYADIFVSF